MFFQVWTYIEGKEVTRPPKLLSGCLFSRNTVAWLLARNLNKNDTAHPERSDPFQQRILISPEQIVTTSRLRLFTPLQDQPKHD